MAVGAALRAASLCAPLMAAPAGMPRSGAAHEVRVEANKLLDDLVDADASLVWAAKALQSGSKVGLLQGATVADEPYIAAAAALVADSAGAPTPLFLRPDGVYGAGGHRFAIKLLNSSATIKHRGGNYSTANENFDTILALGAVHAIFKFLQ